MGRQSGYNGRVPVQIVRDRIDSSGLHEYCVSWANAKGERAGFTWHTSQFLLDGGHEHLVHHFEDTALLRAGTASPNESSLSALEASARRLERESLLLATPPEDTKVSSPRTLAPLASTPPGPTQQRQRRRLANSMYVCMYVCMYV